MRAQTECRPPMFFGKLTVQARPDPRFHPWTGDAISVRLWALVTQASTPASALVDRPRGKACALLRSIAVRQGDRALPLGRPNRPRIGHELPQSWPRSEPFTSNRPAALTTEAAAPAPSGSGFDSIQVGPYCGWFLFSPKRLMRLYFMSGFDDAQRISALPRPPATNRSTRSASMPGNTRRVLATSPTVGQGGWSRVARHWERASVFRMPTSPD